MIHLKIIDGIDLEKLFILLFKELILCTSFKEKILFCKIKWKLKVYSVQTNGYTTVFLQG